MRNRVYLFALACFVLLPSLQPAHATQLPQECYQYLETFLQSETWEVVGDSAIKMYNAGCWPALQASTAAMHDEAGDSPIATCEELAPHIIQVSEASILQIYDVEQFKLEAYRMHMLFSGYDASTVRSLAEKVTPPAGTERVLACVGRARFADGQMIQLHFNLDRDPNGDEFLAYQDIVM